MKALANSQQRSRRLRRAVPAALAVAIALALGSTAYRAADATSAAAANSKASATTPTSTKIRLRIRGRTLTATVARNATARDFVSLLPLTLRMHDLFGREKAAPLPPALERGGRPRHTYAVGDIIYWSPGPDVAVYYRSGGPTIPNPASSCSPGSTPAHERSTCPGLSASGSSASDERPHAHESGGTDEPGL